jgi:flagellar basal body-associated protein FliL
MLNRALKIVALLLGIGGTGIASFFAWTSYQAMRSLPLSDLSREERSVMEGTSEIKAQGGAVAGHGEGPAADPGSRKPSSTGLPLVSMDEIFVNVPSAKGIHSLAVKVEVELFDENGRGVVDERQSGIKDTIITAAREQDFYQLSTLAGKLYFKEFLVGKMNAFLKRPIVKDIHFSSFFLQ